MKITKWWGESCFYHSNDEKEERGGKEKSKNAHEKKRQRKRWIWIGNEAKLKDATKVEPRRGEKEE